CSPDGRRVYASRTDDKVVAHDPKTGRDLFALKIDDPDRADTRHSALSSHLSDDGKTLVALSHGYAKGRGGPEGGILLTGFDVPTRKRTFTRRIADDTWYAVSHDARYLALSQGGDRLKHIAPGLGPVRVIDLRTGEALVSLPYVKNQTWPLAFSPEGRLLVTL